MFYIMPTENSIAALKIGIDEYGCPEQIVTDNGSQYWTIHGGDFYNHVFGCFLIDHGIRHIRPRVSHPQTKGKVGRFFREGDQRLGCLLEEMFPEAKIQMIADIIKPEGTGRLNEFSRTNEFIFHHD